MVKLVQSFNGLLFKPGIENKTKSLLLRPWLKYKAITGHLNTGILVCYSDVDPDTILIVCYSDCGFNYGPLPEGEFLVKKVLSWEGVRREVGLRYL